MTAYVLELKDIDRSMGAVVGGKGANLGELCRIAGVRVPAGFCVTTAAFDSPALAGAIAARVEAGCAYAVRSSATAEDLPTASFAGQHDTYLNVVGVDAVLAAVQQCRASLFTERAIAYREQHGIDHDRVRMAVVIQRMVNADVAGILFTADPITSNRRVTSIDASAGLGDALVSGRVNAETVRVRDGVITRERGALLTDAQILELEHLGRRIEAHFGCPQDIEWCLADGALFVVQARPITTLYPLPVVTDDAPHVYISVGHQQMMTDAIRPLGLSFWLMTTRAPMKTAGGRLFVDVAPLLASPARATVIEGLGKADPLIKDALLQILERGFVPSSGAAAPPPAAFGPPPVVDSDPAIVAGLIARSQASIAAMRQTIATISGPALFDFIERDLQDLKTFLFDPQGGAPILAAMGAAAWLNEHVRAWLGDTNAADTLSRSAPNNPTSEMGLALLDVADAIRPHPQVLAYLAHADDATFLDGLAALEGGPEARAALTAFLDTYGMRCAGEIDITRTRWAEAPSALVPLLLANVKMFAPGESRRRFEHGQREALAKERDILARLRQLPDGEAKATETTGKIRLLRTFIGYREYPKYGMVQRYGAYRTALRREAARLVATGVLRTIDDIDLLSFVELRAVVETGTADLAVIDERREAHAFHARLTPPRVMTSEGEIVTGSYRRDDLPPGALVGLAVSTGMIEGRARVVTRMEDATLEPGDILVTTFTDPSWTPLFVSIRGLVTEVGGLMTHGAVIAREYGLPAVVGVGGATTKIADGARIRVDGTNGYVELLS